MFLPDMKVQPKMSSGDLSSKVALVGDFTSRFDERAGRPFSGPEGTILETCLHDAGLIRGECYATNLFKSFSSHPLSLFNETKGTFSQEGYRAVEALEDELSHTEANILVALGPAAFAALCNLSHLSMYRGYVFPSANEKWKVIPTFHPKQSLRGMFTYRYLIASDLRKAKEESVCPDLVRPERTLTYSFNSVWAALDALKPFETAEVVGCDIEVLNYEVSCLSFSSNSSSAVSLPIVDSWTAEEELLLWRAIQRILGNEKSGKVFQNGMFDIHFLLTRNGIEVKGPLYDTMVGHSIRYPDLPKGLGFLGSIYCGSQEYWKDTVKFKSIKGED